MKDEKFKTTLYLTEQNKKNLRKASYLSEKSYTTIVNELLEKPLKEYLKKIEEKEG
jgi:hypothetical protein